MQGAIVQLMATVSRNDPAVGAAIQGQPIHYFAAKPEMSQPAAPIVQVSEQPAAERPYYLPPYPAWDIRIAAWWIRSVSWFAAFTIPRVCFDWLIYLVKWPAMVYMRARDFLRVVKSGRVNK